MFPTGYFAPAYFAPAYFPREEAAVAAPVGLTWSVINRQLMMQAWRDAERERSWIEFNERQKQEILETLFARQVEWNITQEHQKQLAQAAMYSVLLTEI